MRNPQALIDALGPVMLDNEHKQLIHLLLGGNQMRDDQTQLFKTDYETRCDTFGCEGSSAYMLGRPDGPLNTSHVLCESCVESLKESIKGLSEPTPVDDLEYEVDEVLEGIKTHAALDELIEEFKVEGIPNREEEGGKLTERKEAVRAAFK
jgi:hypothetical protein